MRVGQMDRLIEIWRFPPLDHDLPFEEQPPIAFVTSVWMSVKPLRADEKFSPDVKQRYADVVVRFTSYWIEGLAETDFLKDEQGRWLDIKSVVEVGYREAIEIDAKVVSGQPSR